MNTEKSEKWQCLIDDIVNDDRLTKKQIAFLVAYFTIGKFDIKAACKEAGCSYSVYSKDWVKVDYFMEYMQQMKEDLVTTALQGVYYNAKNGDFQAQKFILEKLHNDFKPKSDTFTDLPIKEIVIKTITDATHKDT